jgi:AraC-like DNA-binding protein
VLSLPDNVQPISLIAEAHGFYNASAFSREFRKEFSQSPSEVRALMQAAGAQPRRRGAAGPMTLRDCLYLL